MMYKHLLSALTVCCIFWGGAAAAREVYLPIGNIGCSTGYSIGHIPDSSPNNISTTSSIAVDDSGNIYLANSMTNQVLKLSPDGKLLASMGGKSLDRLYDVKSIACSPSGNLYVKPTEGASVRIYAPSGCYINAWGEYGSNPGQFDHPEAICIDAEGNVYLTDKGSYKIVKMSATGQFILEWKFGDRSLGYDNNSSPRNIAVDSSGNVYVPDRMNCQIQKYSPDGTLLGRIGGNGEMQSPGDLTVDLQGNLYVVDLGKKQVVKYGPDGSYLGLFDGIELADAKIKSPGAITHDKDGNIYVVCVSYILKLDTTGKLLKRYGPQESTSLSGPINLTLDHKGNLIVTDLIEHNVHKFDSTGAPIAKWGSYGTESDQFNSPLGVTVDSKDNIYVVDERNRRIKKHDPNGNLLDIWDKFVYDELASPVDLKIDSKDNFYILDAISTIIKFSSTRELDESWLYKTNGWLDYAITGTRIHSNSRDNIYATDYFSGKIWRLDSDGNLLNSWDVSKIFGDEKWRFITAISTDEADNIYLTNTNDHQVVKTDQSGNILSVIGNKGTGPGQLFYPYETTVDSSGILYIADACNHRIQKYAPCKPEQIMNPTWNLKGLGPCDSGITAYGKYAFFGAYDNYFYCIDATNGVVRWKSFVGASQYWGRI